VIDNPSFTWRSRNSIIHLFKACIKSSFERLTGNINHSCSWLPVSFTFKRSRLSFPSFFCCDYKSKERESGDCLIPNPSLTKYLSSCHCEPHGLVLKRPSMENREGAAIRYPLSTYIVIHSKPGLFLVAPENGLLRRPPTADSSQWLRVLFPLAIAN